MFFFDYAVEDTLQVFVSDFTFESTWGNPTREV